MIASGSIFSSQYLILFLVCLPDSYFIHSKDVQCFSQLQVVALILARGGSKGLPRKNLIKINGVSLVGRAVRAAHESQIFSEVWVSTDDDEIADEGRQCESNKYLKLEPNPWDDKWYFEVINLKPKT